MASKVAEKRVSTALRSLGFLPGSQADEHSFRRYYAVHPARDLGALTDTTLGVSEHAALSAAVHLGKPRGEEHLRL
jgi:hypothetical protein